MSYKLIASIAFVFFCIAGAFVIPTFAGKHYGELKMIEADIEFLNPQGTSIADETGITFYFNGMEIHDDIIYASQYWGQYPLYLPNQPVDIKVTITNTGPRAVAKHTLTTEAYVLNLDGSNGASLITPQSQCIEVALGETKLINPSLILPPTGKGLNRFSIKLYHHKNDTNEASLVMKKEGVFCPPENLQ